MTDFSNPNSIIQQCKTYRAYKMKGACLGQVKMNGIFGRWRAGENEFYTRTNNHICGLSHLKEILKDLDMHLDGEIVIPNMDFFTANGLIRSFNETPTAVFYVFDCPYPLPYFARVAAYTEKIKDLNHPQVVPLKAHYLKTEKDRDAFYKKVIGAKHEGVVYKKVDHIYKHDKHWDVMKRTPLLSAECRIIEIIEGNKSFANMAGAILVDFKGVKVKVGGGVGMDHSVRRWLWKHREEVIGDMIKVSYKSETPSGSMQSPKIEGIRWDI